MFVRRDLLQALSDQHLRPGFDENETSNYIVEKCQVYWISKSQSNYIR